YMAYPKRDKSYEAGGAGVTRRRSVTWLLGGLVLLLLSVLVVLQVFGLWEVFTPDTASDTLLLYALSSLNFAAFIVFTFIFVRSLLKLRRERRERQLGSKIKTRLVVYFIAVSLLPIAAMAVFSYIFFNRSLEKWFGRIPEDVVKDARLARDEDLLRQARSLREMLRVSALAFEQGAGQDETQMLDALLARGDFGAVGVDAADGVGTLRFAQEVLDAAGSYQSKELAGALKTALWRLQNNRPEGLPVVTADRLLADAVPLADGRTLLAARFGRPDTRLDKIVSGAETFEQLRKRQRRVRLLGLSTLGLLTLMLLFAATWSAIHLARGIATPIRALAEAADEVAGGNLEHRVTAIADDELALLAASFNEMTAQLEENRRRIEKGAEELREKNLALAERRDYIETILESLSAGVVSLDAHDRVTTINAAALSMLRLKDAPPAGTPLADILGGDDRPVVERVLRRARLRGSASEQVELARGASPEWEAPKSNGEAHRSSAEATRAGVEVVRPNGGGATNGDASKSSGHASRGNGDAPRAEGEEGKASGRPVPVALTATAFGWRSAEGRGVVLVMEDLTELLAAQRAAAWSEVARRMAHEIKNPLTPIQL
ncbi:MAG TPA: HAMP domain-containing protein, partial [Pyrinomonadaceae bacterium]|nr:HAMP domain-containing protein [Pyrinomonadaceae bacterium]